MRPDLLISVQELSVSFWEEKRRLQALKDVSFHIPKSKTVCLVGESGCGKSVTARTLLGITGSNSTIDQGTIHYSDPTGSLVDIAGLKPDSITNFLPPSVLLEFSNLFICGKSLWVLYLTITVVWKI